MIMLWPVCKMNQDYRRFSFYLFSILLFVAAAMPTSAQSVRYTVARSGKADFHSVQQAIDHAPDQGGALLLIAPGTYFEKVVIRKPNVRLVGTGASPEDTIIHWDDAARTSGSTFNSGTVWVEANGFEAENLSIVNSYWMEHNAGAYQSQAVALQLEGDKIVLDRVRLISGQDTLYAASSSCKGELHTPCDADRQFFNECFIEGHVDYIFGDANAVFNRCELHSHPGWPVVEITAQGRHSLLEDSAYTMLHCSITGTDSSAHVSFGRPWKPYATVLFYDTDIRQKINPEGWSEWGGRLKTANYSEYASHGPGTNGTSRSVVYPPFKANETNRLTANQLLAGTDRWAPEAEVEILRKLIPAQ